MNQLAEEFRARLLKMRQGVGSLHGINLTDIFYPWIYDRGDAILAALLLAGDVARENEGLRRVNDQLKGTIARFEQRLANREAAIASQHDELEILREKLGITKDSEPKG